MAEAFLAVIIGHLVGDFLLQNKYMAMNKSKSHWKCFIHCFLYTLAVGVFTYPYIHTWLWWGIVFLSHYPIDRWVLADKWLHLIQGRSLREFLKSNHQDIYVNLDTPEEFTNYHVLRGGFTALVYCVADNTMHLTILWFVLKLLLN